MSDCFAIIAARVPLDAVESAVLAVWRPGAMPDIGPIDVHGPAALGAMEDRARRERRRHATTFGLRRDRDWSVLYEVNALMCSDEAELAELSRRIGEVLVLWVVGAGGSAGYTVLDRGTVVRSVTNDDTDVEHLGTPRPEERGITLDGLGSEAIDALITALGLTHPYDVTTLRAYLWYDEALPESPKPKRPWWKLW